MILLSQDLQFASVPRDLNSPLKGIPGQFSIVSLQSVTYSICTGDDPPAFRVRGYFFKAHQLARSRPTVYL